ncbi:MAG: GtrA family protein [Acidimicrobiales bacterium]|jgi:putative flippase GtrA
MPSLLDRAPAALQTEHGRRLVKFATVSVISTAVTQGLLFLTYDVISIPSAMACNVIATTIATFPAYWLNRTWTWQKRGKSDPWKEIAPFWIIAFIGLVLSTVAVGLAAHNADAISQSHLVRKLFVQFANLFTYGLIWVGRYFFFNKFLFGKGKALPDVEIAVPGEVEALALEEHLAREHGERPRHPEHAAHESRVDGPSAEEAESTGTNVTTASH